MNWTDSAKRLLAASGGDTVKLFDVSPEGGVDPCIISYVPSPGFQVNCVKWNHTNLVVASAGDDKKISLWREKGQSMGTIPVAGPDAGDNIEESISAINFSNKGSRYICSGGTGQVVRIWDLQRKRCIKWLKGHTDTITGTMYNCKDEHLASISVNGDLILHNLASGSKATALKDPNKQVLRVLDYSRISRHLLVIAGDDGSVHLWDTTSRSPKVSWLRQHSAPTSGVSFSPSNDKIIASVGLDKKLYTFDTVSKRHSFCRTYDAPFSSLAFADDGLTLAAGTSSGHVVFYDVRGKPQPLTVLQAYGNSKAVTSLCWQRSKPIIVNERDCSDETILLGGSIEDSVLMPDPLPSATSSGLSGSTTMSGSRNPSSSGSSADALSFSAGGSGSTSSTLNPSSADETPTRSGLWTGGTLARLHAPRSYNFKDDMEVFSPVVEVQPITPSFDKLWNGPDSITKDFDIKSSLLFPSSRRFTLSEEGSNDTRSKFDRTSSSTSKQDDLRSSLTQLASTPTASSKSDDFTSITPPEAWGGERLSDKFPQPRQSVHVPSRFATLASSSLTSGLMFCGQDVTHSASQSMSSLTSSSLSLADIRGGETSNQETSLVSSGHVPFSSKSVSLGSKGMPSRISCDSLGPVLSVSRRFSSYAERISTTPSFSDGTSISFSSPKSKNTVAETREQILNNLSSRSNVSSSISEVTGLTTMNGGVAQSRKIPAQPDTQQGSSFTLQLFQRTLEETLASFQHSIHEDMRNLHIEILRQFHMQEMEMSSVMKTILENQAELMKEVQLLRKETRELSQLL